MNFVYRAARRKNWIINGVVQEDAFRRRADLKSDGSGERKDELGLSVAITPEGAAQHLDCKGMIRIDVQKLTATGFSLVADGDHLVIPEPPFDTPDKFNEMIQAAAALVKCSEPVPYP